MYQYFESKNKKTKIRLTEEGISTQIETIGEFVGYLFTPDNITALTTFPGPIFISHRKGSALINKEDFDINDRILITRYFNDFKAKYSEQIKDNFLEHKVSYIRYGCGISYFKHLVENSPIKKEEVKEDIVYRLTEEIIYKGELGWVAATPLAKEVYDLIIKKGL